MQGFKDVGGEYKKWGFKYAVSKDGQVLNKFTNQLISLTHKKNGYYQTHFIHKGMRAWPTIHRVVLNTYRGKPRPHQTQTNHLDGNKANNHVSNLEWCTPLQNSIHADVILNRIRRGEDHATAKYSNELIQMVRDMRDDYTAPEVSKICGVPIPYIRQIWGRATRSRG